VCAAATRSSQARAWVAGEWIGRSDVEGAVDALDVVYRRTRAALYEPDARDALRRAGRAAHGARLGWSDDETQRQIRAVRDRLAADLAFREEIPS